MNAKTAAKRGYVADYWAPLHALNERDSIGTEYWKTLRRQELLEWMDRTPAERRREVQRLKREVRSLHTKWSKADRKYKKIRERTHASPNTPRLGRPAERGTTFTRCRGDPLKARKVRDGKQTEPNNRRKDELANGQLQSA